MLVALMVFSIAGFVGLHSMTSGAHHSSTDNGQRTVGGDPTGGRAKSPGRSLGIPVSADGHYHIRGSANGALFHFLVDTGASSVVFGRSDADRLGYDFDRLNFDQVYMTANGEVRGATIVLHELRIGPITVNDQDAVITDSEQAQPLLGMEFLKRLSAIEISNDTLTLKW